MVEQAKEYIAAGDVIQVVLSQCFKTPLRHDPFDLYRALRSINPSPYMFYLDQGDMKLVGASPEILVRLEDGQHHLPAHRRHPAPGRHAGRGPGAGGGAAGRPQGAGRTPDAGRPGAQRRGPGVPRSAASGCRSSFRWNATPTSCTSSPRWKGSWPRSTTAWTCSSPPFPAGTVTGAPKVRAMEIIEELEPTRRGPYAGAVGYLGFGGNLDFCITIRSFAIHQDQVYLQVGAGIVADSDPATGIPGDGEQGHGPGAGPGPGGRRVDVRRVMLGEPRFF